MAQDAIRLVHDAGAALSSTWHTRPPRQRAGTVVATGIFDLLHVGHVAFLEFARAAGDRLLIGVEDDARTRYRKGARRPVVPAGQRATVLAAMRAVDGVFIVHGPRCSWDATAYADLMAAIEPSALALTEGDAAEPGKREAARLLGAAVVVAPLVPDHSTTALLAAR